MQLEINLRDFQSETLVECEVEVNAAPAFSLVDQVIDEFMTAANFGMFSNDPFSTNPIKTISVVSNEKTAVRYKWRVFDLQVGAFRVLLNMLQATANAGELLQVIRLHSNCDSNDALMGGIPRPLGLPCLVAKPPFKLQQYRNLADCEDPVIRLIFERDVTDDDLLQVQTVLHAWDLVIMHGGYWDQDQLEAAKVDIGESVESVEQTYIASSNSIEHVLYDSVGEKSAFDGLVSLIIRLHFDFCPINTLEIE